MVRALVMSPPGKTECAAVCRWLAKLIADIGMKQLAPPRAFYHDEPGNRGMTADLLLTTSNCVLHAWDEATPGIINFDLYSCADFQPEAVIRALGAFDPLRIEWKFIDREKGLKLVSEGVLK